MEIPRLSIKVTVPIVLAGLFVIVSFAAVEYDKLDLNFYIILSLLSVYLFLFGFATGQHFASPIRKILQKAIDLSKGNLSGRVYLETKDELSELAAVFNKIAEEMQESYEQQHQSEKEVDIKVKAKTHELEEKIEELGQKVKNKTIQIERLSNEASRQQRTQAPKEKQ